MKQSGSPYLTLTLFMLVLAFLAAFFFLFRSWRAVADRAVLAETAVVTREAAEAALATAVNDVDALEAQLFTSEQEVSRLDADLAAAQATLAQFAAQSQDEATRVLIVNPANNSELPAGVPVDVLVVAIDAAGISTVELTINDEVRRLPVNNTPVHIVRESWTPSTSGPAVLSVTATNSDGRTTDPLVFNLTITPPPTAVPAPGSSQAQPEQEAAVAVSVVADGDSVPVGEAVPLIVFVADNAGVTAVSVTVGEDVRNFVADGETVAVFRSEWTPAAAGSYDVVVTVDNLNGRTTTTNALTITVTE